MGVCKDIINENLRSCEDTNVDSNKSEWMATMIIISTDKRFAPEYFSCCFIIWNQIIAQQKTLSFEALFEKTAKSNAAGRMEALRTEGQREGSDRTAWLQLPVHPNTFFLSNQWSTAWCGRQISVLSFLDLRRDPDKKKCFFSFKIINLKLVDQTELLSVAPSSLSGFVRSGSLDWTPKQHV